MIDFPEAAEVSELFVHSEGLVEEKFGFRVGKRVWWVGLHTYGSPEQQRESEQQHELCREIVQRLNAPRLAAQREDLPKPNGGDIQPITEADQESARRVFQAFDAS